MRVGIFGGAFDPVHLGHLMMAEHAREQAALDRVLFVPTAQPPHKAIRTPFERRVDMLELALAGSETFSVEPMERDRTGLSFTADTLDELASRGPGDELFLIVGGDSLEQLPTWHDPKRIFARATLLVIARPGHVMMGVEQLRTSLQMADTEAVRMVQVEMPQMDLSSSDLRQRLGAGQSVRYMVPRAVEVYIAEKRLYKA